MLIFVFGGSASGKSAYAQARICELAGKAAKTMPQGEEPLRMTYLATMENDGSEAAERIAAHRKARAGMGFAVVECPRAVGEAAAACEPFVLLEAVSNLLANEMFKREDDPDAGESDRNGNSNVRPDDDCGNPYAGKSDGCGGSDESDRDIFHSPVDRVFSDICVLKEASEALVVVSDDIFCDGMEYDAETEAYRANLGRLHRRIASVSDEVVEVICGIPVARKGGLRWRR